MSILCKRIAMCRDSLTASPRQHYQATDDEIAMLTGGFSMVAVLFPKDMRSKIGMFTPATLNYMQHLVDEGVPDDCLTIGAYSVDKNGHITISLERAETMPFDRSLFKDNVVTFPIATGSFDIVTIEPFAHVKSPWFAREAVFVNLRRIRERHQQERPVV